MHHTTGMPELGGPNIARYWNAVLIEPGVDRMMRDADVIAALQAIVVEEQRWGLWKCHDRLRVRDGQIGLS